MIPRPLSLTGASVAVALGFTAVAAGIPVIDATKSTVIATFKQENAPVDAPFKNFTGRIDYDPAAPLTAKATLEVQTGSLDLGASDYNDEIVKKSWFDSKTYPKAVFVSTAVKANGANQLQVTGNLTLKGKTATVTVPVTVSKAGAATLFDGAFELSRKAFAIGDPQWDDVLDDTVRVKFHLVE